jgi:hypothetical protein
MREHGERGGPPSSVKSIAHERGRARGCLRVEEMAERAGGGLSRGRARG